MTATTLAILLSLTRVESVGYKTVRVRCYLVPESIALRFSTFLHILASVAVPILWGTVVHLLFHHGVTKRRAANGRDEQPEQGS